MAVHAKRAPMLVARLYWLDGSRAFLRAGGFITRRIKRSWHRTEVFDCRFGAWSHRCQHRRRLSGRSQLASHVFVSALRSRASTFRRHRSVALPGCCDLRADHVECSRQPKVTEQGGSYYRSRLFPCHERLVSNSAVDGLDGILGNDKAVAHLFVCPSLYSHANVSARLRRSLILFFLVRRLAC